MLADTELRLRLHELLADNEALRRAYCEDALFNRLLTAVARGQYTPVEALHWACAAHRNVCEQLSNEKMRNHPHVIHRKETP